MYMYNTYNYIGMYIISTIHNSFRALPQIELYDSSNTYTYSKLMGDETENVAEPNPINMLIEINDFVFIASHCAS